MDEFFPYLKALERLIHPFKGKPEDYQHVLNDIGDARFVLIGEASHGTHEFYQIRAELTRYLIQEKGFNAIAIEGDWPDAYTLHSYVQGKSSLESSFEALKDFKRFPAWMWRNEMILNFVAWLKLYNDSISNENDKIGFYGLDIYSLHSSINAVLDHLEKINPEAARHARKRYSCFEAFGTDPEVYAYETALGIKGDCEQEAQEQFIELQSQAIKKMKAKDSQEFLYILQNTKIVKDAEMYYRTLFSGNRNFSWNLRDKHMAETIDLLSVYYDQLLGHSSKFIIWAHNSHIGDTRATEMKAQGEYNLGQLMREKYGSQTFLLGFTTYEGTVTAASELGGITERKRVRPALPDSIESIFYHVPSPQFFLSFRSNDRNLEELGEKLLLHRAIGVIYRPETERYSHYFHSNITQQYDAILHLDHTTALIPLELAAEKPREEFPETFPSGL